MSIRSRDLCDGIDMCFIHEFIPFAEINGICNVIDN